MLYRIYFRHGDTKEESAREVEAVGEIYRVCDDHGRIIFGEPYPPKPVFFPPQGKEPGAYG